MQTPTTLPIARTVVAIPAFHQLGHSVDELPSEARLDRRQHTLPFDIRHYPEVLAAVQATPGGKPPHPAGIWTTDLIEYDREDTKSLAEWILAKFPYWAECARRALYWREAKPLGILERQIAQNVITDYGALTMLHVIGNAAEAQFFNHLQLGTGAATAQVSGVTANLSAAMGATGVVAIPVVSGGAAFTNGMIIGLGVGTTNTEQVTVGAGSTATSIVCSATAKTHSIGDLVAQSYAIGVTAIPVVSNGAAFTNTLSYTAGFGSANAETLIAASGSSGTSVNTAATTKLHWANDWLVQNPLTADNPSTVANPYDSGALGSGAFAYSGAGLGSRQVQVAYNFPSNAGAPGAGYTDLWMASAATIASNTTAAHQTRNPLLVNSTTGANITYTDSQ